MKKIYFLVVSLFVFSLAFSQDDLNVTFEECTGWSSDFAPYNWQTVDVDTSGTYNFPLDIQFPTMFEKQGFLVFNAMDNAASVEMPGHGGDVYAVCIASTTAPNNDWLISPKVTIGSDFNVSMWVKSYTADYGFERFRVLVSITDSLTTSFVDELTTAPYEEVDTVWTEKIYDLSAYDGQDIFIAINCVSNDAWLFEIDDITIGASIPPPPTTVNVTFTVDCNSISDLDPAVDTFFIAGSFAGWTMPGDSLELALEDADADGVYSITLAIEPGDSVFYKYFRGPGWEGGEWGGDPNRAVYVAADTTITDWWGALAIESVIENDINIYPNPTNNILNITNIANANVRIFNIIGKEVVTINNASNFTTVDMSNLAEGTYIVKIIANSNIITRKISLIK